MTWVLLAILGSISWSISNMIDEHLIKRVFANPAGYIAITGMYSAITAAIFFLSGPVSLPDPLTLLLCLVTGALWLFLLLPYLQAMKIAGAPVVSPLWNLSSVTVAIAAYLVLHETLSGHDVLGMIFLIASALVATYTPKARQVGHKVFGYMILASSMYTAELLLEKTIYARIGYHSGFTFVACGAFLMGLTLLVADRGARQTIRANMSKGFLAINTLNEGFNQIGIIATTAAISLGPVSLVRAVGGLSPIYILLGTFIWVSTHRKTKMTHLTKPLVARVICAVVLAVAGLSLLQIDV